jgi:TolB protein
MRADGSGQRALTTGPQDDLFPVWSPDGTRIAYVSRRSDDEQIHVMNADGSARRRLTRPPDRNTVPVWSPDGTWIAYVSRRSGGEPELYVMRPDGSQRRRLGGPVLLRPGMLHPVWSPDGREIASVVRVGRAEQQISVVDVTTGAHRRLTTGYAPHWSPDGRRIAFVVPRVGDSQIYIMNSDGTRVRRLTSAGANMLPTWSPDGQWLAYISAGGAGLGLYTVSVGRAQHRSAPRRVAEVAGDLSMLPAFSWRP